MRLKNLRFKLKGIKLKRFLIGNGGRKSENGKRASWMMHVSHGYHVVELDKPEINGSNNYMTEFDSVVVQREQLKECDFWVFGVFDGEIGEGVTRYMQSHFFNKMPKETRMRKKCKEAMKRAHLNARSKLLDTDEKGSAWAMVINGDKLVMANMGDYRAVICRDGALRHKIDGDSSTKSLKKSSKLVIGSEIIDSETEFVILASTGVWEVMRHQEAVNLVRHIEDPQAAAECLATEALIRMSKSNISCLVIRFD
ncbi:hypothetical protein DH2020_004646 [Rehmannia glutinosa]|uniref:PPM-type phosphatase domain-containing protein n=1 Tax=Rehmannia glutinosa TaxID=99300 RepID=A0ABR0XQ09_REHGL